MQMRRPLSSALVLVASLSACSSSSSSNAETPESTAGGAAGAGGTSESLGGASGSSGGGASGSGGSSSDPYFDVHDFCVAVGTAICSPAVTADCNVPGSACALAVASHCLNGDLDFAPGSAQGNYLSTHAGECIEALTQAFATVPIGASTLEAVEKVCGGVFSARQGIGKSCEADVDCDPSSGATCWFFADPAHGTCATPLAVAAGMSCSAPGSACAAGYACSRSSDACEAVMNPAGGACSPVAPCDTGLVCGNLDAFGAGTCVTALQLGDDCASSAQCDAGLSCSGLAVKPPTCTADLAFAPGSASCGLVGG